MKSIITALVLSTAALTGTTVAAAGSTAFYSVTTWDGKTPTIDSDLNYDCATHMAIIQDNVAAALGVKFKFWPTQTSGKSWIKQKHDVKGVPGMYLNITCYDN